jgi:hypothetical protein
MIFLGVVVWALLRGAVLLAAATETRYVDLSAYPPWLVVLVGTLLLAFAIWIGMKLLKVALWILFIGVLVGGVVWSGWLLVH